VSRLEPLVCFVFVFLDYSNIYLVDIYCTHTTITIMPGIEKKNPKRRFMPSFGLPHHLDTLPSHFDVSSRRWQQVGLET
jgi:hypothetical protein